MLRPYVAFNAALRSAYHTFVHSLEERCKMLLEHQLQVTFLRVQKCAALSCDSPCKRQHTAANVCNIYRLSGPWSDLCIQVANRSLSSNSIRLFKQDGIHVGWDQ